MALLLPLVELDSLTITVLIDNELDPISTPSPALPTPPIGNMVDIATRNPIQITNRGSAVHELRMDNICCSAHGLSLLITATKGSESHTVLFDTGPEEEAWERNVRRLRPNLEHVERIVLSHWHRDHSGGMLRAVKMINQAKARSPPHQGESVVVDLHPDRPTYRGIQGPPDVGVVSMEADPGWREIEAAGGVVEKNGQEHGVCGDWFGVSGFIPRVTGYEKGLLRSVRFNEESAEWEKDELIADERLLMCKVKDKGVVIFTGCSHAGAVNATKCALNLAGGEGKVPLYAVMGGYHLTGPNEAMIEETVKDFVALDPKVLLPGHCSGWRVKFALEREMPGRVAPSTVGMVFGL